MPVRGGPADKLGNRYEILWAIDQLLQIVDGEAEQLTLEPLDPDESRGIEFVVVDANGVNWYWSVKRQTTRAAGWTLSTLCASDEHGRTILGDLFHHVERAPDNRSIFASTLAAAHLEELRSSATTPASLTARLDQTAKLKEQFEKHILPLCDGDRERACALLQRTRMRAVDEASLRDDLVDLKLRKLLYALDGSPLDLPGLRGHLADLLLDKIHLPIRREEILDALATHGFYARDWAVESSVRDRVEEMCEDYTAPLRSQRINGTLLSLTNSLPIYDPQVDTSGRKVLLVGGAGGGKSTTLAGVVEELRKSDVPVLPIRFDQLPEGILSTTDLGRRLELPESPALVQAGVANGAFSVLVIDQLDAVSMVSGRRTELWTLFEKLHRETKRFPNMTMIVGCREFDLEHDHRIRTLRAEASGFHTVRLKPLSVEQIDNALRTGGFEPTAVQSTLKPVLSVPLHLSMFLSLSPDDRGGVRNREDLFDSFWTKAERRTNARIGHTVAWATVIENLANWLSDNQELSAPSFVLDEFSADAAAMASENVLVLAEGRYRFFHESFFDYAFARRFAARGGRLVELLLTSEQHLFRRAQVRQVLSYLR